MVRTQRELLQAVSHELKTPLARIRFAMDLASTATQESERIKRLSAIDDAVEDLDGLVEELINYVRMEDPSSPLRRESVSVLEVLDGVLHRYRALGADKVFESHAIDPRDSLNVFVDRAAFHRALGNLIGNATRFAAKKVAVSLSVDGGWVAIDIDDDGPGIPEADRGRVLEPFVRLDHQPPRDGNPTAAGVGLGLAIVRRTMEQHGARWEIIDSPLGGCRVRTYWPLAKPATNS
jgi:two-component system sensor histidine kinase RstB